MLRGAGLTGGRPGGVRARQPARDVRGAARLRARGTGGGAGQLAPHRAGDRPHPRRLRRPGGAHRGGVRRDRPRRGGPYARRARADRDRRRRGRVHGGGRPSGRSGGPDGLRRCAALHLGHQRTPQGRGQPAAQGRRADRPGGRHHRGARWRAGHPDAGAGPAGRSLVPLGAAVLRPVSAAAWLWAGAAPRVRPGRGAATDRRREDHDQSPGADPVHPPAAGRRGHPGGVLRRQPHPDLARRRPLPAGDQTGDDRLVGAGVRGVLRRHRGRHRHARRLAHLARPAGHGGSAGPAHRGGGGRRRGPAGARRAGGQGGRPAASGPWVPLPQRPGADRAGARRPGHLHRRRPRPPGRRRLPVPHRPLGRADRHRRGERLPGRGGGGAAHPPGRPRRGRHRRAGRGVRRAGPGGGAARPGVAGRGRREGPGRALPDRPGRLQGAPLVRGGRPDSPRAHRQAAPARAA